MNFRLPIPARRLRLGLAWAVLAAAIGGEVFAPVAAQRQEPSVTGRPRTLARSSMAQAATQTGPVSLADQETRAAVVLSNGVRTCTGAYLGLDAVLTSATCACTARHALFNDGRPLELSIRDVRPHRAASCSDPPAANRLDLAIVRLQAGDKDRLPQRGTSGEAALNVAGDSAPVALALPSLYLLGAIDAFRVVGVEAQSGHSTRSVRNARLQAKVQVRADTEGVRAQAEGAAAVGARCAAPGALAYVWAPPRYVLAGIGAATAATATCMTESYLLLTPEIIEWIVRDHGIPVEVCSSFGQCRLHGAGD